MQKYKIFISICTIYWNLLDMLPSFTYKVVHTIAWSDHRFLSRQKGKWPETAPGDDALNLLWSVITIHWLNRLHSLSSEVMVIESVSDDPQNGYCLHSTQFHGILWISPPRAASTAGNAWREARCNVPKWFRTRSTTKTHFPIWKLYKSILDLTCPMPGKQNTCKFNGMESIEECGI